MRRHIAMDRLSRHVKGIFFVKNVIESTQLDIWIDTTGRTSINVIYSC